MSARRPSTAAAAIVLMAVCGIFVCSCRRQEPTSEPAVCAPSWVERGEGLKRSWDLDADGISDRFEERAAELGYDLEPGRCDRDPSAPLREYNDGELQSGLKLVGDGGGFSRFRLATDWGTGPLLYCLQVVAEKLADERDKAMVIGRLSLQEGGPLPNFESHQNGLELEIYYLKRGVGAQSSVDIVAQPDDYDADATRFLMRRLLEVCDPEAIFAHTDALGFSLDDPRIQPDSRMTTYFNLVLRKPQRGVVE